MDNIKYTVRTTILDNACIDQELIHNTKTIGRWAINTRDKQVIEALIKLGWTPPPRL